LTSSETYLSGWTSYQAEVTEFIGDGMIVKWRVFETREQALEAAGRSE